MSQVSRMYVTSRYQINQFVKNDPKAARYCIAESAKMAGSIRNLSTVTGGHITGIDWSSDGDLPGARNANSKSKE